MQKLDERNWIELVTQPIQTAFQAKQLEFKVRDLTTQLTKLNKTVEKQQLKKG